MLVKQMQVTKLGDTKNIKNIASSGIDVMLLGFGRLFAEHDRYPD